MTGALLWGKLPAHGDFVARGLAPALRDRLDNWLAASLAEAYRSLGEAFADIYDQAPRWRFAWSEEGGWTAGAMAPSTDRVGRRYPVLLALTGLAAEQVQPAAARLDELLAEALRENWTADRLYAASTELAPDRDGSAAAEGWWTQGNQPLNERWIEGARPAGLMRAMLMRAGDGTTDDQA